MKNIIGIDWLQCSGECHFDIEQEKQVIDINKYNIIINKKERGTKDFRAVFNVQLIEKATGEITDFAVITAKWVLEKETGRDLQIIKIYNHVLYYMQPTDIEEIVRRFFAIEKFSRLDFFIDFQTFEKINCVDFIKNIASLEWSSSDRRTTTTAYIENGEYDGMAFGSRYSVCRRYLYNKTKELKKTNKEYISELHKQVFGESTGDVWRLEFSLLRPNEIVLEYGNEDFILLRDCPLSYIQEKIANIIIALIYRYFIFKTNEKRRENCCYIDTSIFFDGLQCNNMYVKTIHRIPSNIKTAKTMIKMLLELNNELRERRIQDFTKDTIYYLTDKYNLQDYFKKVSEEKLKRKEWSSFIFTILEI